MTGWVVTVLSVDRPVAMHRPFEAQASASKLAAPLISLVAQFSPPSAVVSIAVGPTAPFAMIDPTAEQDRAEAQAMSLRSSSMPAATPCQWLPPSLLT